MTDRKLKLVKTTNGHAEQARKPIGSLRPVSPRGRPKSPPLSPAEAAEAARFRELTAARAAQQAIIRRIMAELEDLDDDVFPAA
jgi:hypothetical protein